MRLSLFLLNEHDDDDDEQTVMYSSVNKSESVVSTTVVIMYKKPCDYSSDECIDKLLLATVFTNVTRLLYSLAFNPTLIRRLWVACETVSTKSITGWAQLYVYLCDFDCWLVDG